MVNRIINKIFSYFLQGLLYLAPITITGYIVYTGFHFIDGVLKDWIAEHLRVNIPGLGIVIFATILVVVGFLGQTIIAKPIKYLMDRLMKRVPFLKVIYSALNDLFSAFVGKERKFNKPVIVQINSTSNLEKIGFLTEEDLSTIEEKEKVAVYFPHSYNFSGELFIVPKSQIRILHVPPADVMKFVVSGGVAGWKHG